MIFTIYERMLSEQQRLEKEIKAIQNQISELPDAKLICTRNGSRTKWYQKDGKNKTYISKKNRKLAEQLAIRKYLLLLAEDLLHEKKAIDFYLRHHDVKANRAEQLLSDTSGYAELLSTIFTPLSKELFDWMNSPYVHNEKYPEQLIHKTISGGFVRSKSEAIIAMMLHLKKIPFRYECVLQLGNIDFFPDFTIRHPKTGKIYYWEHFGRMDDPDYCRKTFNKLQFYASHQIIPSIQLLTTFETKENPLSSNTVENIVEQYFIKS